MRKIAAGMGFGLSVQNGQLVGHNISAPRFACDHVAAGAVGVAVNSATAELTAFVRRPSEQLGALVAKFTDEVCKLNLYTVTDVAVSDRAIGIVGQDAYGYRLAVVGYAGLPHQSSVSDLIVDDGRLFQPDPSTTGWLIAVKSPLRWQVTNAAPALAVTNEWLYSPEGEKAPFSHYSPDTGLEWMHSEYHGDCVAAYADYVATVNDGVVYPSSNLGNQYQVRYMPTWRGWTDLAFGHQCGIGRAEDGSVHFWGTQPQ